MNNFDDIGNAILLANQGQQEIARALMQWIARTALNVRKMVSSTSGNATPSVRDA